MKSKTHMHVYLVEHKAWLTVTVRGDYEAWLT